MKIRSLLLAFFIFCSRHTWAQYGDKWEERKCNCDSILRVIKQKPCLGLSLISDSNFIYTINTFCLEDICHFYATKTKIRHLYVAPICYSDGLNYSNISFGKSFYKMDMLLWMRKLGCGDSTKLQKKHYGDFDVMERREIDRMYNSNMPVKNFDTTILWK